MPITIGTVRALSNRHSPTYESYMGLTSVIFAVSVKIIDGVRRFCGNISSSRSIAIYMIVTLSLPNSRLFALSIIVRRINWDPDLFWFGFMVRNDNKLYVTGT